MAKKKAEQVQQSATYTPPLQTQYMPQGQYMPPMQPQPYVPKTAPINPTVSPVNPANAVLRDESVIIAPKKPPKSARPLTWRSLFFGIILLFVFLFLTFMIASYFFVDSWNPFKIIADFFENFDFGDFFRKFFTGVS